MSSYTQLLVVVVSVIIQHAAADHLDNIVKPNTANNRNIIPKNPNVYINFDDKEFDAGKKDDVEISDGDCLNGVPSFYVHGNAKIVEGIHDNALLLENKAQSGVEANCLRSEDLPNECPGNATLCTEGLSYSFWLYMPSSEDGGLTGTCQNILYVGGNFLGHTAGFVPNSVVLGIGVGKLVSFCFNGDTLLSPILDKWTHVVYTQSIEPDGKRIPRLLFDGEEKVNMAAQCFNFPTAQNGVNKFDGKMYIGCAPASDNEGDCGYNGLIDDIRLFDRVLTRREISVLGNPEKNLPPRMRGPCK